MPELTEDQIMPCIECGLHPNECRCPPLGYNSEPTSELNIQALQDSHDRLYQWLNVVLDQVDYTASACGLTEMVGAVLETRVIDGARKAVNQAKSLKGGK